MIGLTEDKVNNAVFDLRGSTYLTERRLGAYLATNRGTLVATSQKFVAALRTRNVVTRSRTGQRTCTVRARRWTSCLGTGDAGLTAFVGALGVATMNIAGGLTWRTGLRLVTDSSTAMCTCRVFATARLFAPPVGGDLDLILCLIPSALPAFASARVPAGKNGSTHRWTIEWNLDLDMTGHCHCVIAPLHLLRHGHWTLDL